MAAIKTMTGQAIKPLTIVGGATLFSLCVLMNVQAETHAYIEDLSPDSDPKGTVAHMAYEWATFNPTAPEAHAPGAVLSAPGDHYRYTVLRDDKYANSDDYEVTRAIVGFHIDASSPDQPSNRWGRIEINGEPRPYMVMFKPDTREVKLSDLVPIISDAELSGNPGSSLPPFVFDVTDIINNGENVTVSITNLREDGGQDSDAPFGGFVVNRIGAHIWYKEK